MRIEHIAMYVENLEDAKNFFIKYFNYIKTSVCNIASTSTIPLEYLEEIKDIFNSGITFWHKDRGARILNYNVKNEVVE